MRFARGTGIVLGLAVLFSWFGVYGTGADPFWRRMVLWTLSIGTGALASAVVIPLTFERWSRAPLALQAGSAAALITLPVTAVLLILFAAEGRPLALRHWPLQFAAVYVVSLVLTLGGYLLSRHEEARSATAGPDPVEAFLERLPVRFRGARLYAVSSEDHYLRVHTDRGEDLILMRLADAVRELEGAGGLQVHRSWWVAREGVADTVRENGRLVLVLKSGARAPVSRTYQPAVKAAGLA